MKKRIQTPALMETMEPRLLFSAGVEGVLLADALPAATVLSSAQVQSLIVDTQSSISAQDADMPRQELVFVDTATPDYQQLVDDLASARENGRQLAVYYLDSQQDGVEQITRVLSEHQGLGAIHIISHGNDQAVQLGNTWLGNNNLKDHRNNIQMWRSALNSDADILIYGCELAGSNQGVALVDELSRLTGADIAASDDLTGQAQRGGDWKFEYRTGTIESSVAFSAELQKNWSGVLGNPVANGDSFSANKNSELRVTGSEKITNNDTDPDNDPLTVLLVSGPTNGTLDLKSNGTFTYTPDTDFLGVDSFEYQAQDKNGDLSEPATVTITVTGSNDAPVANDDGPAVVDEGQIININLAGNDVDANSNLDPTSIVITGGPSFGSISINADGSVDYLHDGSENFADAFTYTIMDNSDAVSNSATVSVNINPLNDAPVANNNGPAVVDEGQTVNINLAGNDTDADDGLKLTSIVITGGPSFGSVSVNTDGTVDYTHDGSENFTDTFTYTILDNSGAVSNSATVSVNINPLNDAPETGIDPLTDSTSDSGDNPDDSVDPETTSEDGADNESSLNGLANSITSTSNTTVNPETVYIEALRALAFNEGAESTDEEHSIPGLDRPVFENGDHHAGLSDNTGRSFLSGLQDTNEPGEGLWDFIETMKNEMSERDSGDGSLATLLAKSATGMGMTLSAGIAAWILRGGSVLASMLSSMPLWRGFDPLPIVASTNRQDEELIPDGSSTNVEDERMAADIFETSRIDTDSNAKERNRHE